MFEVVLTYRRRKWEWQVCDRLGQAILLGLESTRAEAKYQAERGLFLLLMGTRPTTATRRKVFRCVRSPYARNNGRKQTLPMVRTGTNATDPASAARKDEGYTADC